MTETNTVSPLYDGKAAEAFAERISEIINSGAITLMISIGHKTNLFDVVARLSPSTSHQIAAAAELSERYVREWLAAMVTGGIVMFDPGRQTYRLPPEHAACLTRDAALGDLGVYAQMASGLAVVEDRLVECFKTGGGTIYDHYPHFHRDMSEDSNQTVVAQLFDVILPLVSGVPDRLSDGIDVLDAGCGSGRALVAMAKRYPNSRFTGYDLCADAIASANSAAAAAGARNVRFAVCDLTGFDETARYDFIVSFDAVHDQKDPQGLLTALHDALRPGGVYLMQDIGGSAHLENNLDFPMAALLYTISCAHCMPISLGQGGDGLGAMWGWETAERMLKTADFRDTRRHVLPHDPMNVWFVSRKP